MKRPDLAEQLDMFGEEANLYRTLIDYIAPARSLIELTKSGFSLDDLAPFNRKTLIEIFESGATETQLKAIAAWGNHLFYTFPDGLNGRSLDPAKGVFLMLSASLVSVAYYDSDPVFALSRFTRGWLKPVPEGEESQFVNHYELFESVMPYLKGEAGVVFRRMCDEDERSVLKHLRGFVDRYESQTADRQCCESD